MLSNKPMKTRLAVSGGTLVVFLGWLYFQQYLWIWFPSPYWNWIFLMSAIGGAMVWSWTLPHPRQERKRRELQEKLAKEMPGEAERYWKSPEGLARLLEHEKETLAEKRP